MTNKEKIKNQLRQKRKRRIRVKLVGTKEKPRLNIFRGLKHINAQIIDDTAGKTLVAVSDLELKSKKGTKVDKAKEVGKLLAEKAKEKKIGQVIFDRAGYKYHGRIKAVAEGAREGGLKF